MGTQIQAGIVPTLAVVGASNRSGLLTELGIAAFDGTGTQWERNHSIDLAEGVKLPGVLLFVQSARSYPNTSHHIGRVRDLAAQWLCARSARSRVWGDHRVGTVVVQPSVQGKGAVCPGAVGVEL